MGDVRDVIFGLSGSARAVLEQLFIQGPTSDGDIIDKNGRGDLVAKGLAARWNGWAFLTEKGVRFAIDPMLLDREKERRDNERRRRA